MRSCVRPVPAAAPVPGDWPSPIALDDRLRDLESSLITWALKVSKGNKSKAAELLQIKRSTLGDRINRCGLGNLEREASSTRQIVPEPSARQAGMG